MELHNLLSVAATAEQDVYTASVDITDLEGARYTADYVSRAGDTFGLAPAVRNAVDQWIADGKTVVPYVAPKPVVPERVSARQFGLQLIAAGLKDQVDAWVAQQDDATQWAYHRSATFVRNDPMMQGGFSALGFTTDQIAAFFVAAAAL